MKFKTNEKIGPNYIFVHKIVHVYHSTCMRLQEDYKSQIHIGSDRNSVFFKYMSA